MKKYEDTILDLNGNAVSGASVTVKDYPGGTNSTIYSSAAGASQANPLTTGADGYFVCYLKDGAYNFQVSRTGITTETQTNVVVKEPVAEVNVDGYGAVGDGSTDDTAAIQAAENALTTAGGVLVFSPGKTYQFDTQLTKKSNVSWRLDGATLQWGGSTTVPITSGSTGVLKDFTISGGKIDIGTASKCFELKSPYNFHFDRVEIASNSSTNVLFDFSTNTSGTANGDSNYNAARGSISNILQSGTCGTFAKYTGNDSSHVCTLIGLHNINAVSCKVRGLDFAQWADSFALSGMQQYGITANSAVGIEFNSADPTSDVGVYNIQCPGMLAVDAFGSLTGRVGVKLNNCKDIKIGTLYQDPAAEGGQIVASSDAVGYEIGYYPASSNVRKVFTDSASKLAVAQGRQSPIFLAKSGTAVTAPEDTNTNTLATVAVPAGAMGANGRLRIIAIFNAASGTTNRTLTINLGSTALMTKVMSNEVNFLFELDVFNANDDAVQYGLPRIANTSGCVILTPTAGTEDTSGALNLTIKCAKATGSDPLILKAYSVELFSDGN